VFVCPRNHTFDIARSGYVSLVQPQDRRSVAAGDAKAALDARVRLIEAGVGGAIQRAIVERATALAIEPPVVVDLGAGSGDALAALTAAGRLAGIGIDLSTAAAAQAARRFPALTWVVANADRRLPLLDRSVGLVVSIHGRRNPAECARVLSPNGALIVAVPATDDLVELREIVQGERVERDRADAVLEEHGRHFALVERGVVREQQPVARGQLLDLLRATYRGERHSSAARVAGLDRVGTLELTTASEWFLFALRPAVIR
jgi:23S rRNA (guanine745-N1)-methyltransferase